jgi:uncharacterized membrane protein
VRCESCGHDNPPEARLCANCGAPLLAPGAEAPQELEALRAEVRHLRELVIAINNRLTALEGRQETTAPPPEPAPVAPVQEVTPPPKAEPLEARPPKARRGEWEQILGGSWLARIGVLALVIGIGFFLKFAFDNNWLGPTGRVILGVIVGLAMLGAGYWWRKRYPVLTQVLSGGGIAVLYLSIFASFAIYDLVHFYVAFAFLFLVSVASAVLALRYNSMSLAIIGILGAFIAPLVLGAFGESGLAVSEASRAIQLLVYILVVDIGVLILSSFRNWRWFTLLALFGSLIAFGVWYGEFERDIGLATAEIGITIIFLIFVGATTLFHIIWRRAPQAFDFTLMMINAAAYFGISLGLMWDTYRAWMGGFVFLIALFYAAVAYLAFRRQAESPRLSLFALGIAVVLLTVALPIQLGDKAWTTIAWAAEGAVLAWLSSALRMPQLRWYSCAVFLAVAVRLFFFDTPLGVGTFQPVLNERFLAFAVSIAALYAAGLLLLRESRKSGTSRADATVFLVAANFFTLWLFSFEVWDSFSSALRAAEVPAREGLRSAQHLSLTAVWAFYAVIGLVLGIVKSWRYVRLGALVLLLIAIIKVFVFDVFKLELGYRIGAFVGLGILLLVSAYLYQRYRKVIRGVFTEK